MSTISLLPPERSHMVRGPLLAHEVVAAGPWPALGGPLSEEQAASISAAAAARAGHFRLLVIPTHLPAEGPGSWTPSTPAFNSRRTEAIRYCIRLHTIVFRLRYGAVFDLQRSHQPSSTRRAAATRPLVPPPCRQPLSGRKSMKKIHPAVEQAVDTLALPALTRRRLVS